MRRIKPPTPTSLFRVNTCSKSTRSFGSTNATLFNTSARRNEGGIFLQSRVKISPFVKSAEPREDGTKAPLTPIFDGTNLYFEASEGRPCEIVSKRWLRDQCPCGECVHPETKQRQMDTFKIQPDISIESFEHDPGDATAKIRWQGGHESVYPVATIRKSKPKATDLARRGTLQREFFDATISASPPTVEYDSIMSGNGVAEWTRQIGTYGGFYDFTANLASKDTAYTNLSLGAHTDTTYFSEPAGLQMFHMLSHTNGSGGESLLVDGFAAAAQLYEEDMEAYRILSTVRIWSHASGNEDVSIQPYTCFPVLSHDPVMGHLVMVRWNDDDRAGIEAEGEEVDKWYEAASRFNRILNDSKNQYWSQLEPGVPLIFDNWRVLHGRGQFTGKRRMSGGYINRDDFISKLKLSNMTRDQVLESTVTG
ncbi:hypothetical protein AAFC00_005908 [Neodothiora populina]|uniref:trimethyllysine dioxygenase n=1 Tax=Neodothiora populina TaxID=2781224 RepID=A0ABR3P6A2_9PEZI